ncbi:hypothetical protein AMECASPLE_013269, partial [Ameca splendens]
HWKDWLWISKRSHVSHLLHIDNIKLNAKNERDIDSLSHINQNKRQGDQNLITKLT